NCYYAMSTYNSFTAAPALGDSSLTYNWSFTSNGDGTWKIMNTGTSKWIQYDEGHSNIAPSMNAGAMPMLFKLNAAGTAFENIDPVEGGDSGDDVIPTPTGKTLVSGWAELPETLEKAGDYYYTWHITDAKYSNGNKARNYSVCYSKDKMCTMWVAAPMHTFYIKGSHGRTDDYDTDPNFDFTQPGKWSGYTRGHLIASNNRHAGVTSSGLVNRQAFYYSNIAPQLSNFNSGDWGSVDNVMDKQWESRSDTTYAVYGCYWDKANGKEIVSGTKVPTHYYMVMLRAKAGVNKWVVNCSKDELECIAIMMEHKNWDSLPALSTFAMSVADLEKLTGFVYFGNVPNAPKDTYKASSWGL
ncbi:MAG: DNA/RNA non-specific endonuclease, partial [Alistipes sp.]|nr:DNA/RNA non-specific endonuclease [Alistipes sp.]